MGHVSGHRDLYLGIGRRRNIRERSAIQGGREAVGRGEATARERAQASHPSVWQSCCSEHLPSLNINGMKPREREQQRKEFQSSFTSAGTPRIFSDRRSRLCAPGGSPSAPGISPGVGSGLHQIDLGRAWKWKNTISAQLPLCLEKRNVQLLLCLTQLSLTSDESSQPKSHKTLCLLPPPPALCNYLYLVPK